MFRSAVSVARVSVVGRNQARLFATTPAFHKGPVEAVKDAAKTVDRKVSDAAVSGIEKGQQLKDAAVGSAGGKADEVAGEVKGKAKEMAGEAKGKAEELKGEAKAAKEEAKSKM